MLILHGLHHPTKFFKLVEFGLKQLMFFVEFLWFWERMKLFDVENFPIFGTGFNCVVECPRSIKCVVCTLCTILIALLTCIYFIVFLLLAM